MFPCVTSFDLQNQPLRQGGMGTMVSWYAAGLEMVCYLSRSYSWGLEELGLTQVFYDSSGIIILLI